MLTWDIYGKMHNFVICLSLRHELLFLVNTLSVYHCF